MCSRGHGPSPSRSERQKPGVLFPGCQSQSGAVSEADRVSPAGSTTAVSRSVSPPRATRSAIIKRPSVERQSSDACGMSAGGAECRKHVHSVRHNRSEVGAAQLESRQNTRGMNTKQCCARRGPAGRWTRRRHHWSRAPHAHTLHTT